MPAFVWVVKFRLGNIPKKRRSAAAHSLCPTSPHALSRLTTFRSRLCSAAASIAPCRQPTSGTQFFHGQNKLPTSC